MTFRGTYTALITPFRDDRIDTAAFKALIDRQVAAGITGIVPVGTTGESPTLDMDEHIECVRLAVEYAAGRCQVVAGTGANATKEAIELTQAAEKAGATGTLQVCPYYNKPSRRISRSSPAMTRSPCPSCPAGRSDLFPWPRIWSRRYW